MAILLIDDSAMQRLALAKILEREGYTNLLHANSAKAALDLLSGCFNEIDLILTDLKMPEMDGIETCRCIKAVSDWADIPIIMVTSSDEMSDLQAAFEAGAMDYITKPPNKIEILVRVRSALKLKHEIDWRKAKELALRIEQERSERLLLNTLPKPIVERLKQQPQVIADYFPEASVLFADIVGFTPFAAEHSPEQVVKVLNDIFSAFDSLADDLGLEKIKTMGDSYMVVGGVPMQRPDHAQALAEMGLSMLTLIREAYPQLQLRIGIHTGAVVAGVIGIKKFSYDLWGDTVNLASRMESQGCVGAIQVSEESYKHLRANFRFKEREPIQIKGRGEMKTYILQGRC
jgi:adenylate cyclase